MPYVDPDAKRAYDRRYYLENRERIKENVKSWQDENRDRVRTYKKKWFDTNPEYKREWYLANREKFLEQSKANAKRRLEENPERIRAMARNTTARYRARRRQAFIEYVDPLVVWERDEGVCQLCGKAADPGDWHLDHIVPIARDGEHSYANTQVTHPYCNRAKAAS